MTYNPLDSLSAHHFREAGDLILEKGWCRESYAREKNGFPINLYHKDACSFCFFGALFRVSNINLTDAGAISDRLTSRYNITSPLLFNDEPGQTAEAVATLLYKIADVWEGF